MDRESEVLSVNREVQETEEFSIYRSGHAVMLIIKRVCPVDGQMVKQMARRMTRWL